jgi:uncharacterized protein (DUF427 family)
MSTITDTLRRFIGGEPQTNAGPVQAVWNGTVVAESGHTVVVEGNHYFPPEDVKSEYLKPSKRHSVCPWKGVASYYDVVVDGQRNRDAAWCYQSPSRAAARLKGHVAFRYGVKVKRAAPV